MRCPRRIAHDASKPLRSLLRIHHTHSEKDDDLFHAVPRMRDDGIRVTCLTKRVRRISDDAAQRSRVPARRMLHGGTRPHGSGSSISYTDEYANVRRSRGCIAS